MCISPQLIKTTYRFCRHRWTDAGCGLKTWAYSLWFATSSVLTLLRGLSLKLELTPMCHMCAESECPRFYNVANDVQIEQIAVTNA